MTEPSNPPDPRNRGRRALLILLAAAGVAICSAQLVAPTNLDFEWGELSLQLTPSLPGGDIALDLGPVGELSWKVHSSPVDVKATFLLERNTDRLPNTSDLENLPLRFAVQKLPWLAVLGALVGALVAWGWGKKPLVGGAVGAGGSLICLLTIVALAALTFRPGGLEDPRYRGPVEDVPRVLSIVRTVVRDFEDIQQNIARMVAGLQRIQSQISATTPVDDPEPGLRILVVSDLHNNPIGMLIGQELVDRFKVEGVIDAGDFSDQGTVLEGELFTRFASVEVPYVIAPGNHEDEAALTKVAAIPNVSILDVAAGKGVFEIGGLKIVGDRDAMSSEVGSDPRSAKSRRETPVRCRRLAEQTKDVEPTIVIVHRREMGECAATRAQQMKRPLVFVWGHMHRQEYEEQPYLVSLSPGTSGANGVKTPVETPYGFSLLEFDRSTGLLVSTCQFQFDGPSALRSVKCHLSPDYIPDKEAAT